MKLCAFLVIFYVVCSAALCGVPSAQAQTSVGGPDRIKALLLRPIGWVVEWNAGQYGSGEAGLIYEARGDKVVVVIENFDNPILWSCERDVTFTADGFTHDGCRDNDVTFRFDPDDPDYPFKGGGGGLKIDYRLKAKW
jgi:hypothetical protein